MNSYSFNYATQNQRVPHPNYRPSPTQNPIQVPINNLSQVIPQYISPQPINMNPIPSGYNQINILPHKNNLTYQQPNIKPNPPPNQNVNIIQPQHFIQNTHNIINNQSSMINTNLAYNRQNQIPLQNNNILYNPIMNLNQNINQGKINQVQPLNMINNNIKKLEKTQNINQINILYNKSSIIQREGKDEALNDHRPIPMKLADKAKLAICKISYRYNNKKTLGTGFFMKYSDTLKLLITNYHVIYPELMNSNIQVEIWNNKKFIINLQGRYIKFFKKFAKWDKLRI